MTPFILHLMSAERRKSLTFFYWLYTSQTLLLLLIMYIPFVALPVQYIIHRKQPGQPTKGQNKIEKRNFWRNVFLMALVPVPIITLLYKTWYVTVLQNTPWYFLLLETIAIILLHDAYFYRTHRLLHLPFFYKRFHRVHHASVHPTLYTALNFDMVELLINYSFLIWFELLMWALFGWLDYMPVFILMTYTTLWNFYGHSWVELYSKRFRKSRLGRFIMSSTYHDVHHSRNDWNYAFFFTFRDRICGTISRSYENSLQEITDKK